ncbi:MAG: glycosyl transferase [Clostridia bacterium]|nr:glycosyl transferase [Clostridia bacterium]
MHKENIIVWLFKKFIQFVGVFSEEKSNKIMYKIHTGKKLNLKKPKLFNEKLMKLKIDDYNNNELVSKCADKYKMQEYVKECGLEQVLNPIYKVYSNADEIDFNELPNKFVLKCNHGCGYNIICTNKETLNIKKTKKLLNKWLKIKFGKGTRELHYLKIKPLIICEKYIETNEGILPNDYKIYCFNGEPKLLLTCTGREEELKLNFYDFDWNELMLGHEKNRAKNAIKKPECLIEMVEYARVLAKPFKFVRVDFYDLDGKPVLGELTFTPARCSAAYYNDEGSKKLGEMLKIED